MKNVNFEGVITPMVTPLIDRETIDFESLEKLIEHLVNGGVNGIFLMGTTGECHTGCARN